MIDDKDIILNVGIVVLQSNLLVRASSKTNQTQTYLLMSESQEKILELISHIKHVNFH